MRKLLLISILAVLFTACSVEPYDPNKKDEELLDAEATSEEYVANSNKDVCSFKGDPDKGCLKAVIASSELYVDGYYYEIGIDQFAREFNEVLSADLDANIEFAKPVTIQNFFNGFSIRAEGPHTTYSVYHTGSGNLLINSMAIGYYNIFARKEFEMKVLNEDSEDYKCAVIWSRTLVDILPGEETVLYGSIAEFQLKLFDESCSGKKPKSSDDEVTIPEEENASSEYVEVN